MADVESAGPIKTMNSGSYNAAKSWDLNRTLNALAVWSLITFWVWVCFYWMLQYAPMPLIHMPGSKENVYPYGDAVVTPMKNLMCPSSISDGVYGAGSPISYCVWYFPAFISFTIVALLVRRSNIRPSLPKFRLAGDMDFVLFSYIAVFIPLIIFFGFYMYKKWPTSLDDPDKTHEERVSSIAGTFANRLGFVGFWFLTFFMIPATRHGPVLAALNWHPYHACTIHMFCGWASWFFSMGHFIGYLVKYFAGPYPSSRDSAFEEMTGGWQGWQYIFPPAMCWTWNTKDFGQVNETTGEVLRDDEGYPLPPLGYSDCGKMLSGFYGTVSIAFFTILVICSLQVVRRYRYQVFYWAHIICAPLFILFCTMHYRLTYQYFWPSCFYYFATQAPFLMQHNRKTINNYGLRITGVMDIPCRQSPKNKDGDDGKPEEQPVDNRNIFLKIFDPAQMDWLDEQVNRVGPRAKSIEHCVSFDFDVTDEGFEQFKPGMYGNIWCPDAGMKSHPFSVTHVPGRLDQLRIIFRVFGKWTDLLARSLIQLPCPGHQQEFLPIPKIMMDGWHGPDHLVGSALNHDKVVIVTAGIGITAFLSMFTEMIEVLCFNEDGMFIKMNEIDGVPMTREFALHWTCRDENLIKYITDEYFQPLAEKGMAILGGDSESYSGVKCKIHIHRTGPAGMKTLNPTSLWKSFRDKTERGVTEIDFGLLGTFGVPWSPYRFSFGKWKSLWRQLPSIFMFCLTLWLTYFFSAQVHFWLLYNPFELPGALNDFIRIFDYIPTLFISFTMGWLGHVATDWTENIHASKKNASRDYTKNTEKTVDDEMDDGLAHMSQSLMTPEGEEGESSGLLVDNNMISLESTTGRPPFDELVEASESAGYQSTGIFLCGPEMMIKSCKKAAGMSCQYTGERLQMFAKGNKFVFYEEKFEW
jgi:hypothetical protein